MFCDFHSKLKKLNKNLWIDTENRRALVHPDFPCAGLYLNNQKASQDNLQRIINSGASRLEVGAIKDRPYKYIMGVPHQEVPEYSIYAVVSRKLALYGFPTVSKGEFYDSDFIETVRQEQPQAIEDKPLWKGYRAILAELTDAGHIDSGKAGRLFGIEIEIKRKHFPRRYLSV